MTTQTAQHLLNLGKRIIAQRKYIFTHQANLLALREQRDGAELALLAQQPDGKWSGKNEDDRKASRRLLLYADHAWVELDIAVEAEDRALKQAQHELQLLLDEKEAFELAIQAERMHQAATSLFGSDLSPNLANIWAGAGFSVLPIAVDLSRREQLLAQVPGHPPTNECPDPECAVCSVRDCPHGDDMHYDDDGCPSCESEWGDPTDPGCRSLAVVRHSQGDATLAGTRWDDPVYDSQGRLCRPRPQPHVFNPFNRRRDDVPF